MPPACRRDGFCSAAPTTQYETLIAEPGFSGLRLTAPAQAVLARLPSLAMIVAATSNSAAVITHIGPYAAPQMEGEPLVLAAGRTVTRLHPQALGPVLAIDRGARDRMPCSLQVFDREGAVLHKAFLTDLPDDACFAGLKHEWARPQAIVPETAENDGPAFDGCFPAAPHGGERQADWGTLDSAFQLDSTLGDNGLSRRAALPARSADQAWQVQAEPLVDFLTLLCEVRMPLAMIVGNAGLLQLHRGMLDTVRRSGSLALLTSERCTVSIDLAEIEELWVTRFEAHGREGLMLELYDWRFHCVARFTEFATENEHLARYWRQLVRALPCPARRRGRVGSA